MEHPALDDETANRLLRGSLPPEDAPAGFEAVAALFRAATGPATDDEVADPHGVVQALAAELRGRPAPLAGSGRAARRGRRLRRLVASPALVAALVATGAAAAAAATGDLPRPVQSAVAGVASHAGIDLPEPAAHHGHGRRADAASHSRDTSLDTTATTGTTATLAPPLNGPALRALCGAYASGNGAARGGKADATPFRALTDAATAAGQTVGQYCAAATAATGDVTAPTTAPTTPPTSSSAPPSDGASNTAGAQHGPPATLGNGAPHPSTSTTVAHGNPHGTPPGQQNANPGNGSTGNNGNGSGRGGNRTGHP